MGARSRSAIRRPKLGGAGLVLLIALANTFVCMSLDMYLPAIPTMAGSLGTTPDMVNLTMVLFYAFLAIGTVLTGPLSEKYGRRAPLLACVALYLSASIGCALSLDIAALIICRIGQALGGGGMVAISTALVKDCFEPERRGKVLAVANAVSMVGPMAAPIAGSALLALFSWHAIFYALAFAGGLCLALAYCLDEPLARGERYEGSVVGSLRRLFVVVRRRSFTAFLLASSLLLVPFMGYVSVSSFLYIDFFGLDAGAYGAFYAANTLFSVVAPLVYIRLSGRWGPMACLRAIAAGTCLTGALLVVMGGRSPLLFLLSVVPMTVAECLVRPVSVPILLEQQKGDTGSASSLINFAFTLVGSGGMLIGTFHAMGYLLDLAGLCAICAAGFMLAFWLIARSRIDVKGLS